MPSHQGSHDGLCGIYAIANAYAICGYDKPEHEDEELQEISRSHAARWRTADGPTCSGREPRSAT